MNMGCGGGGVTLFLAGWFGFSADLERLRDRRYPVGNET